MIKLKSMTLAHFWLMFSWANDPKASEMTRDFKRVSLLEHVKWFYRVYNNPTHQVQIIHEYFSNKPVGYVQLIERSGHTEFRIKIPEFKNRNLGYGSQTLNHIISLAKEIGIKQLYLQVRKDNYAAIRLYRKFGFIQDRNFEFERNFSGEIVLILTFYKVL